MKTCRRCGKRITGENKAYCNWTCYRIGTFGECKNCGRPLGHRKSKHCRYCDSQLRRVDKPDPRKDCQKCIGSTYCCDHKDVELVENEGYSNIGATKDIDRRVVCIYEGDCPNGCKP